MADPDAPDSDPRERSTAEKIEIRPTGAALGADAQGVDFGGLSDGAPRSAMRWAGTWCGASGGTGMSDADYMALGRRLGEIVPLCSR